VSDERHPQTDGSIKYRKLQSRKLADGASLSLRNRGRLPEPDPTFANYIAVEIPFSYLLSKNAIYGQGIGGHKFIREGVRGRREMLTLLVRSAAAGVFVDGPIDLALHVEKPNARGDAINVLTTVADAVVDGLGVDDRWFGITCVTWSVVKIEPRVLLGIGQRVTEPHRVCSYCGGIWPMTDFQLNRSGLHGRGRKCRHCSERRGQLGRVAAGVPLELDLDA
jgi:hypothetical protein